MLEVGKSSWFAIIREDWVPSTVVAVGMDQSQLHNRGRIKSTWQLNCKYKYKTRVSEKVMDKHEYLVQNDTPIKTNR